MNKELLATIGEAMDVVLERRIKNFWIKAGAAEMILLPSAPPIRYDINYEYQNEYGRTSHRVNYYLSEEEAIKALREFIESTKYHGSIHTGARPASVVKPEPQPSDYDCL